MSAILHALRPTSWSQRVFLLVLGLNSALILLGLFVVPSALHTLDGLAALLGTLGLQPALALLAVVGPISFVNHPQTVGISLVFGALFAAAYLGLLAVEFAGIQLGINDPVALYGLFVAVAVVAGALASRQTQRLRDGVVGGVWALVIGTAIWSAGVLLLNYGLWGSPHWYQFWLGDGAVDDFHRSGSADFAAFMLQDLQGALFFHQVLSAVIGSLGGLLGGGIVLVASRLWRRMRRPSATLA